MISTAPAASQQRLVPPSELPNPGGEAANGFESMLAAANATKAAPPTPPHATQAASNAPRHAAPAERGGAVADGDPKPAAPEASGHDASADETKTEATASPTPADASADPSGDAADSAAPPAPAENASILSQIIAALGAPGGRPVAGTADASTDAAATAGGGAGRRGLDLGAARRAGAAATGASRQQAAADTTAASFGAASSDASQGFAAALGALPAGGSPDSALAALGARPATADTAPIPTAGALDIASLGGATPASTTAVATAHSRVESRVGSAAFGDELVDTVKQFAMDKIEVAQLVLNPEDMGPVRVEIAYDQGQAAVHFTAERAETRQALESRFDQLRSALSGSGIDLGSASTGQFAEGRAFEFMQQGRDRGQGSGARAGSNGTAAVSDTAAPPAPIARATRGANGKVDLFA